MNRFHEGNFSKVASHLTTSHLTTRSRVTAEMTEIDALEDGILSIESAPLLAERRTTKSNQVRQAGLQRIEKDMFTVNQLFKDLSGMVVQQNDMIRSVEVSVNEAAENTSRSKDEIAKTHKRYTERQDFAFRAAAFLLALVLVIFLSRRMLTSHW